MWRSVMARTVATTGIAYNAIIRINRKALSAKGSAGCDAAVNGFCEGAAKDNAGEAMGPQSGRVSQAGRVCFADPPRIGHGGGPGEQNKTLWCRTQSGQYARRGAGKVIGAYRI